MNYSWTALKARGTRRVELFEYERVLAVDTRTPMGYEVRLSNAELLDEVVALDKTITFGSPRNMTIIVR